MAEVGDIYETDFATYEIIGETRCKYKIRRTNKNNHPSPNKQWIENIWKNCFYPDRMKKIN